MDALRKIGKERLMRRVLKRKADNEAAQVKQNSETTQEPPPLTEEMSQLLNQILGDTDEETSDIDPGSPKRSKPVDDDDVDVDILPAEEAEGASELPIPAFSPVVPAQSSPPGPPITFHHSAIQFSVGNAIYPEVVPVVPPPQPQPQLWPASHTPDVRQAPAPQLPALVITPVRLVQQEQPREESYAVPTGQQQSAPPQQQGAEVEQEEEEVEVNPEQLEEEEEEVNPEQQEAAVEPVQGVEVSEEEPLASPPAASRQNKCLAAVVISVCVALASIMIPLMFVSA